MYLSIIALQSAKLAKTLCRELKRVAADLLVVLVSRVDLEGPEVAPQGLACLCGCFVVYCPL